MKQSKTLLVDTNWFYTEPAESKLDHIEDITDIYEGHVLVGHAIPVPYQTRLYKPKFDILGWQMASDLYQDMMGLYAQALEQYNEGSGGQEPTPPEPPIMSAFWVEGYTQQELDDLLGAPTPESNSEKIVRLEQEKAELAARLAINEDVTASISADLQALMEYLTEGG